MEEQSMPGDFVTKTEAIKLIGIESGYGRHIVERKLRELARRGEITIERNPSDKRKLRIPKTDISVVVSKLTGDF
jgi:DNA-binding MarR family transcriptional regulator